MGLNSPRLFPVVPTSTTSKGQLMGLDEDFLIFAGDLVDPDFVEFFENNETFKKVCLE